MLPPNIKKLIDKKKLSYEEAKSLGITERNQLDSLYPLIIANLITAQDAKDYTTVQVDKLIAATGHIKARKLTVEKTLSYTFPQLQNILNSNQSNSRHNPNFFKQNDPRNNLHDSHGRGSSYSNHNH